MPVKTTTRGRKRVRVFGRSDVFSTAMLLPNLHPWLKEFFAESNLVPVTDEAVFALPRWEAVPEFSIADCRLPIVAHSVLPTRGSPIAAAAVILQQTASEARVAVERDAPSVQSQISDLKFHIAASPPEQPVVQHKTPHAEMRPSRILEAPPALPVPLPAAHTLAPVMHHTEIKDVPIPIVAHAPPQTTAVPPTPTPIPQRSTIDAPGSRRSSSPTPFAIPVAVALDAPALSSNVLRIARPLPRMPAAPNFLHAIEERLAAIPAAGRAALPHVARATTSFRDALRADGAQAPWFTLPAPYNELLIVSLLATPMERCWRAFGWQTWRAVHALAKLRRSPAEPRQTGRRGITPFLDRRRAERLWRMERDVVPVPTLRPSVLRSPFSPVLRSTWSQWTHAAAFAGALLLILLPVKLLGLGSALVPAAKGRVLGAAASVIGDFRTGGHALATSSFADAIASFDRARGAIARLPASGSTPSGIALRVGKHLPVIGTPLRAAANARDAGLALADASSAAARGLALLATLDPASPEARPYLRAARAAFTTAQTRATVAAIALRDVNLPLADTVAAAAGSVRRADALLAVVEGLAGLDRERRILLLFQNPAELRPTGGFIGSVALLNVRDGAVRALEVPGGGAYDISGLTRLRVHPPEPLRLLTPTWQFHDANWFPDFPASAAKLRAFAEASGWPTVDAVVAVQAPFLADVLRTTGPATVGDRVFTADDVLTALTNIVEDPAARASGAPKAVIGDLAPALLDRLLGMATSGDATDGVALVDLVVRALDTRDLQLAFTDDAIQRAVADAHWDGALRPAAHDALAVVHTNIGGGKSDAVMRDAIHHDVRIAADGHATATITITRTHTGTEAPRGAPPAQRLTGMQNVDYLRVYVPRGSTLRAADGFDLPPSDRYEPLPTDALPDPALLATESDEQYAAGGVLRVTEEFGRTAIGGWLLTKPGTSRTATLTIQLPLQYERTTRGAFGRSRPADPQPYTVFIQRQPGTAAILEQSLTLDPAWRVTWSDGAFTQDGATWKRVVPFDQDAYAGMMIAPR